eukprot:TRINITY_DN51364_c0_g1_i1.p1 TRINITY_DN51364_c0_g1~~TRINITY_DN51364_c0_g1_i1.p1  ORF type:complete len:461 (-),score=80.46 TRINITY_DN51364_c0_g1_i1:61-1386(-)
MDNLFSNVADQAEGASALDDAGEIKGTLHAAASSGSVRAVTFLLSRGADVKALDSDGKTARQLAEAGGHTEVVKILTDAENPGADAPAASNELPGRTPPSPVAAPSNEPPSAPASPKPEQKPSQPPSPKAPKGDSSGPPSPTNEGPAQQPGHEEEIDENGDTGQDHGDNAPMKPPPKSRSTPALGSYGDLKEKTYFSGATTEGVLKRTTYMTQVSTFRSGPKYTLASRGQSMFLRSSATPAPGTYNLPDETKSKYKGVPQFSFGGVSRFGLGESPNKKQPGPGAYNPRDPTLHVEAKVGFGTAVRGRGSLVAQANPGPGAYEQKSGIGNGGKMFTAGGRHPTSYMRARSLPGPGAYNPSQGATLQSPPKCGFGTSTRDDVGGRARNLAMPGPGAYELQNFKSVGADAPKFSATSRRKMHDLNSYVTPGPGTYNSHVTSFGY